MATMTGQDVAEGLRRQQFMLYYQPKASLISNRIVGAEALARWRLADGTVLPPADFIGLAERGGMINTLTLQLLPLLFRDLAAEALGEDSCVSLNVTVQDFENEALTDAILGAIIHGRLRPGALELEITETQALHAGERVLRQVQALTEAGVGLAMDDYGIGYSSMDTLSQWPFTTIKLDQGIVSRMLLSDKNATIVRSSIRLGHELGINVVAEGVETAEQHDFLVEAGCKLVQGYLVSPPLPLAQFLLLRDSSGTARGIPVGLVHMALVDHIQWRRQMVSYAIQRCALAPDAPLRQAPGHPQLCVTRCALGRWYFGEGRYFAQSRLYLALAEPHAALHTVGERIVARVRAGAALREVAPLLTELKQVSGELLRLLEDIEDVGLQALYEDSAPPAQST